MNRLEMIARKKARHRAYVKRKIEHYVLGFIILIVLLWLKAMTLI